MQESEFGKLLCDFFEPNILPHSILRPDDLRLDLDTAENYKLSVTASSTEDTVTVSIESPTVFGYLRALETLSQLCSYDRLARSYFVASGVEIEDAPKFKGR